MATEWISTVCLRPRHHLSKSALQSHPGSQVLCNRGPGDRPGDNSRRTYTDQCIFGSRSTQHAWVRVRPLDLISGSRPTTALLAGADLAPPSPPHSMAHLSGRHGTARIGDSGPLPYPVSEQTGAPLMPRSSAAPASLKGAGQG